MGKPRKFWEIPVANVTDFPHFLDPPPRAEAFMEVFKIEVGREYEFHVVSDRLVSMYVHYLDERTMPCLENLGLLCEFCGPNTSRRWMGYVAARSVQHKKTGIVPITVGAYQASENLKSASHDLFGSTLYMRRLGGHRRGRVSCRLDTVTSRPFEAEKPFTAAQLVAQLFWIWGVRFKGGTQNGKH